MELEKSSNKAKKSYEVKWPMATREKKVFVLTGEGIECEKESKRFFSLMDCVQTCEFLPIYDFLDLEQLQKRSLNSGDLIFIPGGFSFADHYGAGKLLAHKIAQSGVLDWCFEKGVDLSLIHI